MDKIIDAVSEFMREFNAQSKKVSKLISEDDIASFCEVFVSICLGTEELLRGAQVDLVPLFENTFSANIEETREWFRPMLINNIRRGVPEDDIISYTWGIFIRQLCIIFPNYMPPVLGTMLD